MWRRTQSIAALVTGLVLLALLTLVPPRTPSLRDVPFEVMGFVFRDLDGEPIAGARVYVVEDPVRWETRTDRAGEWRLRLPPVGSGEEPEEAWLDGYRIRAEAEGHVRWYDEHVDALPGRGVRYCDEFVLARVAARIAGEVLDAAGKPVPGAEVTIEYSPRVQHATATTDPGGRFERLKVAPGYVTLRAVRADLRGEKTIFVPPGRVRDLSVTLQVRPPLILGTVTGEVVDEKGRPVPDAEIVGWRGTRSGPDGRFAVPVAPRGKTDIRIRRPGYGQETVRAHVAAEIRVVLETLPTLDGRLLLPSGAPAGPGYEVCLRYHRGSSLTNARGAYHLDLSGDGVELLRAFEGRRFRGSFRVDVPEGSLSVWRDLVLPRLLRCRGRVVDVRNGRPLVDVAVMPYRVLTDEGGRYEIEVPETAGPDDLRIVFYRAGYDAETIRTGAKKVLPKARLSARGRLRLRVLDADGNPVHGASVDPMAYMGGGKHLPPPVWTDRSGAAEFDVDTDIPVCLAVGHQKGWRRLGIPSGGKEEGGFAPPGRLLDLGDVTLEPHEPGTTIRVVDDTGAPIADAYLMHPSGLLLDVDSRPDMMERYCTEDVLVSAPGRESVHVPFEQARPGSELRIVLHRDAPITGRIVDERGEPCAGLWLMALGADVDQDRRFRGTALIMPTDTSGAFEIRGLRAGEAVELIGRGEVWRPLGAPWMVRGGDSGLVFRTERR